MNEHPKTTVQHGDAGVEPQNEVCPTCAGSGSIFESYYHKGNLNCPACGGTGKLTDAVARKLSGES